MNRIEIDGIKIEGRIEGLDNLSITYNRKGESGAPSVGFSNELTIFDDGYDYIKEKLIDTDEGRLRELKVQIFDDCCEGSVFDGKITGTTIEWCEDECSVRTNIIQDDDDAKQLKCLRSTLVSDNSFGFKDDIYPQMTYCNELRPNFLHDIIILNYLIQKLIIKIVNSTLIIVIAVVNWIVEIFGALTGIDVSSVTQYTGVLPLLEGWLDGVITGCGRRHPTPLVRNYIQNVCQVCGIGFSSSILNNQDSDYFNLAYLNAPIRKGKPTLTIGQLFGENSDTKLIEDNLPFKSGIDFLEEIKTVFNAEYRIINGTLVFERKDYFESTSIWRTTDSLDITDGICYSWEGDEKEPAAAIFQYSQDGVDLVGDEARSRYNDVVSWDSGDTSQEGVKEVNLLYGALRVRDDGIERDVVSFWSQIEKVPFIGQFLGFSDTYKNAIVMENGRTSFPKLIIWDGNVGTAGVKRFPVANTYQGYNGLNIIKVPNYPMFFDADRNKKTLNLYEFHKIDDPRISTRRNMMYDFTASFDCDELSTFDISKNLTFPDGKIGTMETVTINYTRKTIDIQGKI